MLFSVALLKAWMKGQILVTSTETIHPEVRTVCLRWIPALTLSSRHPQDIFGESLATKPMI